MTKCSKILGMFAVLGLSAITMFAQEQGVVINGVTWATSNVDMPGTFADTPEKSGMFYQWNRKIGWSNTNPMVNHEGGTTWDSSIPTGDSWERANDPCPTGWRVPTYEEEQSLLNSGSFWGELNSVSGRYFGSGEHVVFFPAAGQRSNGYLLTVGLQGHYWGSTVGGSMTAYALGFGSVSVDASVLSYFRDAGFSIRCVADDNVGINEVSSDTEIATVIGYFDILGKRLNEAPKQGIYIILYDNGKTKKVMSLKE